MNLYYIKILIGKRYHQKREWKYINEYEDIRYYKIEYNGERYDLIKEWWGYILRNEIC